MNWLAIGVISALVNLLLGEFFGWFPWMASRLIRHASGQLPSDVRVRYEDEWLAELEAIPSMGISSLLFAMRVRVRAPKVKRAILGTVRPAHRVSLATKRAMDCVGSVSVLWLLAPLLSSVALAVTFSSRGPVLVRRQRVGRDGKLFFLLSFRTIYEGSVQVIGRSSSPVWRVSITPVGRLLRDTGMHALPMLINVIKGEMSLVGPCPTRPALADRAVREIHSYNPRPPIRPGITGLAQLRRLRREISLAERIELDNYYVLHRSIGLDMKILARTVLALFRGAEVEYQR